MKITIDLGNLDKIQRNIDAQQRVIDGNSLCCDTTLLIDNLWVLKAIRDEYDKNGN